MNITEMLGLQDERMESVVKEHWAEWVAIEPRLGVVDDPCRLDAWRRGADPTVANGVLLGLARLAAFDGADDREAALVLAWLLLPTALRVRRRLGLADDRVDEVLAAQLWVEVRGLPWRRPHWVAAKVAGQLREGVLLDCGAPTHHMPHRLSMVSLGPSIRLTIGSSRTTTRRPSWPNCSPGRAPRTSSPTRTASCWSV